MQEIKENEYSPLLYSLLMHSLLVGLLVFNLDWLKSPPALPAYKVIDAVIVDASQLKSKRLEPVVQPDPEPEIIQEPLLEEAVPEKVKEEPVPDPAIEQHKVEAEQAEMLRLQKATQEADKAKKLKEQKAAEEKKRLETKRKEEEKQRVQKEKTAAEKKQKEAEQEKLAEQQKLQKEQEATARRTQELQAAIAREEGEQLLTELRQQYSLAIQHKVTRNWINPSRMGEDNKCVVNILQIPGGEVVNVVVTECSGGSLFQRSVENAVHKASPLPYDGFESVFERSIIFTFNPNKRQ